MKKLLFILLIVAASCKKEKSNCWKCQIVENGVAHEEKMCGSADGHFVDSNGNELQCYQIH
jgi:hypothetical protein